MQCPKCKRTLNCPCRPCKERRRGRGQTGVDFPEYIWSDGGETITCPFCGYSDAADKWEEYEYQLYYPPEVV